MKKSRIALAILLAAAVVISTVSVAGFAARKAVPAAKQAAVQPKAAQTANQNTSPRSFMLTSVENIVKVSEEANRIVLRWDENKNADGYKVYICDKDASDDFNLIADVKTPTADILNLKDTTAYWFRVSAYKSADGVVYESPATTFQTATQAGDVSQLDSQRSSEVLKISWNEVPKATAYEVYRADKSTKNEYVLCTTIQSGGKMEYEDKDVKEGELYSYKIRPYRTIDSLQYCAKGKTIDLISGLSAPANLVARSANTRITLYWSEKKLATGYNIYMSTDEKSGFKLLGSTDELSYSTDKLKAGTMYYFRVQPFRKTGDKVVNGTWSTCKIEAAEEKTQSAPKSSIQGKGTYIEVSVAQQHMWFYENGKLVVDTDVVTGNKDSADTPTGTYSIESRAQDTTLTGEGYSSFVSYWMGFYGGYGIHDASWRSSFGGDIYEGNGSHGCVNTPYEKVKIIYEHTDYGTPVYVY